MQRPNGNENSSGYASNVKPGEKADIVVVIGPDEEGGSFLQAHYEDILNDCEKNGLKYTILGNGKTPVTDADIKRLPQTDHVMVVAHGDVEQVDNDNGKTEKFHVVDINNEEKKSTELLQELQAQTGAKKILFGSCHSGRINQDIKENNANGNQVLATNSELITTAEQNETAISSNVAILETNFIQHIGDSKKAGTETKISSYYSDMMSKTPDTVIYSTQQENDFNLYANRRNNLQHVAFNQHSIESSVAMTQNDYNNFLHGIGKDTVQPTKMSTSDVDNYRNRAAVNYAAHNDHEAFKKLLDNNKEHSDELRRTGLETLTRRYDRTHYGTNPGLELLDLLVRDGGANMLGDILSTSNLSDEDCRLMIHDLKLIREDDLNDEALNKQLDTIINELQIKPYKALITDINYELERAKAPGQSDTFSYRRSAERLDKANQQMNELYKKKRDDPRRNPVLENEIALLKEKIQEITENNNKVASNICNKEIPDSIDTAASSIARSNEAHLSGDSEKANAHLDYAKDLLENAKKDVATMQKVGAMDENTKQLLNERIDQQLNQISEARAEQAAHPVQAGQTVLPDETEQHNDMPPASEAEEIQTVQAGVDGAVQLMDASSKAYINGDQEQANAMLQRAKSQLEQAGAELQQIKNIGGMDESTFKNLQEKIDGEMKTLDDLVKKRADANVTVTSTQTPDQQQPPPSKHEAAEPDKDTVTSKVDGAVQLMDASSKAYVNGDQEQANAMLQRAKSQLEQAGAELQQIKNIGGMDENIFKNLQGMINEEMKTLDDLVKKRADANVTVENAQTPDQQPQQSKKEITHENTGNQHTQIKRSELQEQIKTIKDKIKTQSSPSQTHFLDEQLHKAMGQLKQLNTRAQESARYNNLSMNMNHFYPKPFSSPLAGMPGKEIGIGHDNPVETIRRGRP